MKTTHTVVIARPVPKFFSLMRGACASSDRQLQSAVSGGASLSAATNCRRSRTFPAPLRTRSPACVEMPECRATRSLNSNAIDHAPEYLVLVFNYPVEVGVIDSRELPGGVDLSDLDMTFTFVDLEVTEQKRSEVWRLL